MVNRSKTVEILFAVLLLCVVCFSACSDESPSEIEEYLCEVFTPNTICKRLSDGKYFFIYETYDEADGWNGELIPLENIRDVYEGNDYCCKTVKSKYTIDETVCVELTNSSDSRICFNNSSFILEYLFDEKWYTIRTGSKTTSLSPNKNITCESGETQTFEITESALFEFYKNENIDCISVENDRNKVMTKRYEPTLLRPGHYRYLCPVLIFGSNGELPEKLLIACEFDIVEGCIPNSV